MLIPIGSAVLPGVRISKAVIPGKSNRKKRIRHDKEAYTQCRRTLLLPPQRLQADRYTM
jgi:hypothetical protein